MLPNMGIYKISNVVTNKIYVGSSANLNKRFYEHKRQLKNNVHKNRHLQFAWNKHGLDAFQFSILEIVIDKSKLIEREQFWLDWSKPQYNLAPKAYSQLGTKRSDESKKKISIAAKNISEETRRKMKEHVFSEEHKRKLAIARRKRITTEETRKNLSKAGTGRKHSEETKLKCSLVKIGHIVSKQTRDKQ